MAEIKEWMTKIHEWTESNEWHPLTIEKELMDFHLKISDAWKEIGKGNGLVEVYFPSCKSCNYYGVKYRDVDMMVRLLKHVKDGHKPEGFPIEIADLVIRILQTCAYHGIDLDKYMEVKHTYNLTRLRARAK